MSARRSMPACQGWSFIPAMLLATQIAVAAPSLDELCPIEWRNIPLNQAMEELTGRFQLPVLFDESVTPELGRTPVRLFARHLTGRQALRWLARWAGLEAAFVEDSLLIAQPDRLPSIWREDTPLGASSQPAPDAAWKAHRERSADIEWIDAPPSLVSRDVSIRFGLDLIIHRDILKTEALVNFQQTGATLGQICDAISGQLDGAIDLADGALWLHPRANTPSSGPASQTAATTSVQPQAVLDVLFTRQLTIDTATTDWETFARILIGGAGPGRPIQVPPGAAPPQFTARGTAREILEAAKLLGRLDYRLEPSGTGNTPVLLIKVR